MTSLPNHSRRDFLQGKAAAQALAAALPDLGDAPSSNPHSEDNRRRGYLVSLQRRAMACDFEIQFPADRQREATEHALRALELIDRLEDQLTVYRDDSELVRINLAAARQPISVEPRLYEVLKLAERLYRETAGALDITSGPLSRVWGFTRREGRVPNDAEIQSALAVVGFDKVVLDDVNRTVLFLRDGIELNLNSMGKGYALDRAAEALAEAGVSDFLLHGGKSSVLARGNISTDGDTWRVGLRDPLHPESRLAELLLCNEALSTSGSATQFFRHEGRTYGHILDPRTGWPAEGILTATVIAPTAVLAEALSTAFYVMGPDAVEAYCEKHSEIRAVLVGLGDRADSVRLMTFGMSDANWDRPGR